MAKGIWGELKMLIMRWRREVILDYLGEPRILISGRGRQEQRAGRRCGTKGMGVPSRRWKRQVKIYS